MAIKIASVSSVLRSTANTGLTIDNAGGDIIIQPFSSIFQLDAKTLKFHSTVCDVASGTIETCCGDIQLRPFSGRLQLYSIDENKTDYYIDAVKHRTRVVMKEDDRNAFTFEDKNGAAYITFDTEREAIVFENKFYLVTTMHLQSTTFRW